MLKNSLSIVLLVLIIFSFYSCRQTINNEQDTGNGLVDPPPFGPGLTVISPQASEIWEPGTRHEIIWDVIPNEFNVDILLYRKTEFKLIIAQGVENNGSYFWRIPPDIDQSHHYRIKIRYTQNEYQTQFSSAEFCVIE
ncbi:Ser-Thr-rich GPI-anchored membrane family protein [Bacteroidota bacterium]